jgi:hypothetical protein
VAYTANEYKIVVAGTVGTYEAWSNDWCVLDVGATDPIATAVAQVRGFYNDLTADLHTSWHAASVHTYNLSSGAATTPTWTSFAGANVSPILPTQVAVRVSLDDLIGHHGGPFIPGYTNASLSSIGTFDTAFRGRLLGAVEGLASGLLANGFQLRINRPSVGSTVAALQARVGTRFDVIRKRSDNTPESYASALL